MPHYLYRIAPARADMHSTGPTPQEAEALSAHFGYLQRLTELGTVMMAGRSHPLDNATFGLVLLSAETETQARALMQADPVIAQGVMHGELHLFRIALWNRQGPDTLPG